MLTVAAAGRRAVAGAENGGRKTRVARGLSRLPKRAVALGMRERQTGRGTTGREPNGRRRHHRHHKLQEAVQKAHDYPAQKKRARPRCNCPASVFVNLLWNSSSLVGKMGRPDLNPKPMDFLSDYEGRYIMLQESKKVDQKQLDNALRIAHNSEAPEHITQQCQAASAKDKDKGRVVAILELGETSLLNTAEKRRRWEKRTFVPARDLKQYRYVTKITRVHSTTRPWPLGGGQTLIHAWAPVDALPSDLKPDILQRSAEDEA